MSRAEPEVSQSTTGEPTEERRRKPLTREEFGEEYLDHAPRLFRYFWVHTHSRDLAEDLVSETFADALTTLDSFDPSRGDLGGWLFGIGRRALARHIGYVTRRRTQAQDPQTLASIATRQTGLSPEERVDIWRAVHSLPEREREIIALKFGAGLMHREIAALLGLTETHVGVLVYRTLQRLRARLSGEESSHARQGPDTGGGVR